MERKCVVAEHRQGVARNKRGLIALVIRLRVSRNDLLSTREGRSNGRPAARLTDSLLQKATKQKEERGPQFRVTRSSRFQALCDWYRGAHMWKCFTVALLGLHRHAED
jgi:hypothetical protein